MGARSGRTVERIKAKKKKGEQGPAVSPGLSSASTKDPKPVAGVTYSELARREAELARAELARAETARKFALRQIDDGLRKHFLRVASRYEQDSSNHAERAARFEALAVPGEPIPTTP